MKASLNNHQQRAMMDLKEKECGLFQEVILVLSSRDQGKSPYNIIHASQLPG
jgi:hypothetical protein